MYVFHSCFVEREREILFLMKNSYSVIADIYSGDSLCV